MGFSVIFLVGHSQLLAGFNQQPTIISTTHIPVELLKFEN